MIRCTKFIPVNKGTLIGFANLYIDNWKGTFYGFGYHEKDGKKWVKFPSRLTEINGEKKYFDYFQFENPIHRDEFLRQAKLAIENKLREDNV